VSAAHGHTAADDAPQPVPAGPGFRVYPVEYVTDRHGRTVGMRLCEEWVPESERWEPFYTHVSGPLDDAG
jgi:hypothetical protein